MLVFADVEPGKKGNIPVACLRAADRRARLAYGQEMRAKAANEPFEEHLERGSGDCGKTLELGIRCGVTSLTETHEQTHGRAQQVVKTPSAHLEETKEEERSEECDESSSPNRDAGGTISLECQI